LNRKKLLFSALTLTVLLVALLPFAYKLPEAKAQGQNWLFGWCYRKSHVINPSTGAGTDYQIRITAHYGKGEDSGEHVYLNENCKPDFSDVRFTDDDGKTLLSYWIMEKVDGDYAIFWVKVADDLSNNPATIYVYYGNENAESQSNFDDTFIFGDLFDSPTLDMNRWVSVDGVTYTIDPTNHYVKVTGAGGEGSGLHSKSITLPDSWIIEDAYDNAQGYYQYMYASDDRWAGGGGMILHNSSWSHSNRGIAATYLKDTSGIAPKFYIEAIIGNQVAWSQSGTSYFCTIHSKIYKLDGNITIEKNGAVVATQSNDDVPNVFHIGAYCSNNYGTWELRYGAFKIRKYVDPEPSHSVWGYEEATLLGWGYRKSHVINPASGAGTNYQVRITAHYGSGTDNGEHVYLNEHSQTDFGDVRFTDDDGNLLDYWMEEKVDGNYAVFWVEVADDLSTSSATIYIYYGNPNVETESDGEETFLFFEDFEEGSLSFWTIRNWHGSVSYSIVSVSGRGNVLKLGASSLTTGIMFREVDVSFSGFALDFDMYTDYYGAGKSQEALDAAGMSLFNSTSGDANDGNVYQDHIHTYANGFSNLVQDYSAPGSIYDRWNTFKYAPRADHTWVRLTDLSVWHSCSIKTGVHSNTQKVRVFVRHEDGSGVNNWAYVDDIRLRKYVDPEPSHGAWGTEEIVTDNTTIVIFPEADAYIDGDYPDDNIGDDLVIGVTATTDVLTRGYLRFDLSSVPNGATIIYAELKLYVEEQGAEPCENLQALRIADDTWEELTITWNNQPALGDVEDTVALLQAGAEPPPPDYWLNFTVTTWVQNEFAGDGKVSFCIKFESETRDSTEDYVDFTAREADGTNYDPRLVVHYFLEETNNEPSIGSFQAPATAYAHKWFNLTAVVNDPDGTFDIVNATVEINGNVILKWERSTDMFFELADPNGYCTINATASESIELNSTAYRLDWCIMLDWTYPEGYASILNATVFDTNGACGTNSHSNFFTFEDDLIVYSASADAQRVDPGDTIAFTGKVYLQGAEVPPDDTSGITAKVELDGSLKGATTTIDADGSFTILVNAESLVAQYTYTVYATTDQNTVQNQTVNVIVDRVQFTVSADSTRVNVGENAIITVQAVYEYDSTSFQGTYALNDTTTQYDVACKHGYKVTSMTDSLYGLTTFTTNEIAVIWDALNVTDYVVDVASASVYVRMVFAYDGSPVQGGTVGLAGYAEATNSTGWVAFDLSSGADLSFGQTAYGVSGGGITAKGQNQTIPIARCQGHLILTDAQLSSVAWNSTIEAIQINFTNTGTFTLNVSGARPTYILNASYSLDQNYTSYLHLSVDGANPIAIAYPNWGDFRIQAVDHRMTTAYWTNYVLNINVTGATGEFGALQIFCGSRGSPKDVIGLADVVYNAETQMLTGTYTFQSEVSIALDWTPTSPSGGTPSTGDGGGGSGYAPPSFEFTVEDVYLELARGQTQTFNLTIRWSGTSTLTISAITFDQDYEAWFNLSEPMPIYASKTAGEDEGTSTIPATIVVPWEATPSQHTITATVTVEHNHIRIEKAGTIYLTVQATTPTPQGIPQYMTYAFLIGAMAIAGYSFYKKR